MSPVARIIVREFNGVDIRQTTKDGYWDATAMCKANGKQFSHWRETGPAKEHLKEIELTIGIPIVKLVQSIEGRYGGTWVHPLVANLLAIWCSPRFAVKVSMWIEDLKQGRYPQARANDPAVLSILTNHEGRLSVLEEAPKKREKRNPAHDRLLMLACRRLGGKCPCGCGRQMLEKDRLAFVPGVEVDHWNNIRTDNRLANKWPLFVACHILKHQETAEEDFYLAFKTFQKTVAKVEKEDTAIIPPSPARQRVIDELNAKRLDRAPTEAQPTLRIVNPE